ncbi:MCE family protein [Micromonospora sp. KC723]|uniref:MCE family protein n=1 Tax=Micromonospora sp. KC723 TaxID=2530381 RepID=UPI00104D309B|nr:MlaD family protein [Micromonospora sp. KC723]TDB76763.1 MCE family protein [Micromonospora sp. KC723]
MIGRGTKLKVFVFVVVSLLGVTYVGVRYVGLGDRLLGGGYVVHLDLARAGGIFPHAPVTYRGVPVGRVTAVTLRGDGVRADLRIQRGVRVPAQLRAVIAQRSAVGEQYVDLRPDRDVGPYLRAGAVIPADRTGVPLAPEVLLSNLDALVRSVGPDDLAVLVTELGTAFAGNEQALARILDAGDALLADATEALPETLTLIEDARTVLATQAESAEALRRWAAGLAQLAAAVRAADPDLRRLLAAGPPAGQELVALLRGLEPTVGTLLGNLITVNGIAARRLPGIEQLLVVYPITVAGGFTVTPGDGTAHLGLVLNANDPPACVYRSPERGCSAADRAAGAGVRGAANAPRPSGAEPAFTGGASRAGAGTAGYDPVTGLVLGSDGRPLQFGGTGGQYRTAGDQSWKQLLLAGVTP